MFEFIKNMIEPPEPTKPRFLRYKPPVLECWTITSCHINNSPVYVQDESEEGEPNPFENTSTRYLITSANNSCPTIAESNRKLVTIFQTKEGDIGQILGEQKQIRWFGGFNKASMDEIPAKYSKAFIDVSNFDSQKEFKEYWYVYRVRLTVNRTEDALTIFVGTVDFKFDGDIPVPELSENEYRLQLNTKSETNERNVGSFYRMAPLCGTVIPEAAMNKINSILKQFIVNKFGKDICSDFTAKTLEDAFALAYYPTEPRMFYLMDNYRNPNRYYDTEHLLADICRHYGSDWNDVNIFYNNFGKIPDSIKKMYRDCPETLAGYLCLQQAGISDINFIRNLIDAQRKWFAVKVKNKRTSPIEPYACIGRLIPVLQNDFNCTQKKIIRILYNDKPCDMQEWKDCIRLFLKGCTRFAPDSDFVRTFMNDGICRCTHDFLAGELSKIGKENIPFRLTEIQKKRYEHEIDGFNFKLAENSHRLIEIGSIMSICVGSYDDRVLEKKCLIVYAEKDGSYKACIEVREYLNVVHQARAKFNASLTGAADAAFRKWLKVSKLKFNGNSF